MYAVGFPVHELNEALPHGVDAGIGKNQAEEMFCA